MTGSALSRHPTCCRVSRPPQSPYLSLPNKPQTSHVAVSIWQCGSRNRNGKLHFGWAYRSILASCLHRSQWSHFRHSTTGSHVVNGKPRLETSNRQGRDVGVYKYACPMIYGPPYGRTHLGIRRSITRLTQSRRTLWLDDRRPTFYTSRQLILRSNQIEVFPTQFLSRHQVGDHEPRGRRGHGFRVSLADAAAQFPLHSCHGY
jgi:hypothetical protein